MLCDLQCDILEQYDIYVCHTKWLLVTTAWRILR
jgi:hypothetical protein